MAEAEGDSGGVAGKVDLLRKGALFTLSVASAKYRDLLAHKTNPLLRWNKIK